MSVHPAKTQISVGICPVWSESSLSAWRKLGSLATHWAHSEDWSAWADAPTHHWAHTHFVGFLMSQLNWLLTMSQIMLGMGVGVGCFYRIEQKWQLGPCHEKTCLCHVWTTKVQISLLMCTVWISTFVVHCLDSIIPLVSISKISSL